MANDKEVIYIDIDDEITGIIDKVKGSNHRIVALVLPKRAAVFQSIVNMKLLKRSADEAKKHMVLITAEVGLLPLAGAVGLHVAKTLTSKPAIPAAPGIDSAEEAVDEETGPASEVTAKTAGNKPVGELAGAAGGALAAEEGMETLELDNEEESPAAELDKASAKPSPKKDKKLKIPDFDRFRLMLVLGGLLLIALIFFFYLAAAVLPKATIDIKTNASNVNTNVTFTVDMTAKALDHAQKVVPAKQVQEQKTYTQVVPASGQKNIGNKASGAVNMAAKECYPNLSQPSSVPAGTGISTGGLTFISQSATVFSNSGVVSGSGSSTCITYQATGSTSITAQSPGTKYNVDTSNFTVAGRPDVSASGSASGGTDNIVKVVSQADIDSAKQKINTSDDTVRQSLTQLLEHDHFYVIAATFSPGTPAVTTTANVGDTVDNVTVTEAVTYTMYGVQKKDLQSLLADNIKGQIDDKKQGILDDGLGSGTFKVVALTANGAQLNLQTTGLVGPQLSVDAIRRQAAGKKSGAIQAFLKDDPGVTDVTVHMSPFWVTSAPKKLSKITVKIAKPTTTIKSHATNP